jgi:hypothetical protein
MRKDVPRCTGAFGIERSALNVEYGASGVSQAAERTFNAEG